MKRKRLAAGVATDLTDRYAVFFELLGTTYKVLEILMIKSVASP
jgi:hypothetical protein